MSLTIYLLILSMILGATSLIIATMILSANGMTANPDDMNNCIDMLHTHGHSLDESIDSCKAIYGSIKNGTTTEPLYGA